MLKSRTILFLITLEKQQRGNFAFYFGRPIPITSFSFRGLRPRDPLTRESAPEPRGVLRSQTPVIGSRSRVSHVLASRTSKPNSAHASDRQQAGTSHLSQRVAGSVV